ncbi:hypothetical protein NL676_035071 [Syzygium grande]|nr:hypothetical protein NL676_035071 [Syzygium grande]
MCYVVSVSQVCLAFAPNSADADVDVYGNIQLRTLEVIYDVLGGEIGFGAKVNSTVKLAHKHGPCSPLFKGEPVNHTQLLLEDIARVEWIESKYSGADATNSPKDSAVSLEAKYNPNAAGYFVTIGVGTPKQDMTLLFDTGSALTWTQCKPCAESCSKPIFDPSRSSSYANISFSDPSCLLLRSGTGHVPRPSGSTCSYKATYLGGASSEGFFATETLTLSRTDAITRFKFGCSQKSEKVEGYAGLLGLARDEISFFDQSATKYGRSFSYCLPFIELHWLLNLGHGQQDIRLSQLHAINNDPKEATILRHQDNRNQCRRQTARYRGDRVLNY